MHALAIAKFIGKKQTEAKNLLKILWKKSASTSGWEQEELERAWLLYADSFIAIQKYDQAEEVLKKCLKQNKSCGRQSYDLCNLLLRQGGRVHGAH
jgi:tetratricopeptide repeat protein 21B